MAELILGPAADPATEVRMETAGALVRRSVLPGGIRVLTEHMPSSRSAAFGAWVAVGSRDETDGHHGSTHFLEHLLFKGTPTRDAMSIASAFDAVGGESNAATAKEHTVYYARVLDADLPMAVDVITDMVTSAVLDPEEFESERGVILEELAMASDDPADVAHEAFAGAVFGDHPLGRPIGGTPETINAVPREAVLEHYRATYRSDELIITAAGNIDHDDVVARVLAGIDAGGWDASPGAVPVDRRHAPAGAEQAATGSRLPSTGTETLLHRTTEQSNVLLGGLGLRGNDPRRYDLAVLNAILGGSMSSRLFQEVREKRGLAYSVYSFGAGYSDAGMFGMYAGCAPNKVNQVVELLEAELTKISTDVVSAEELARGTGQVAGGLVLGMEDSGARMSWLGQAEVSEGELITVDEHLAKIHAVTAESILELATELRSHPRHLVVVGPGK